MKNQELFHDIFQRLMQQTHAAIDGVMVMESGVAGPCVGITIGTHGNEPAGLSVADYFMQHPQIISCGTLYLIHNNPGAMERYFAADNEEAARKTRYVDCNMNRLPDDVMKQTLGADAPYEFKRAQALFTFWQKLVDGVLDIHSTSAPSPSMLMTDEADEAVAALLPHLSIDAWITGITAHIDESFAKHFCGHESTPRLLLEAGQHQCENAGKQALDVALRWLASLGMLANHSFAPATHHPEHYHAFGRVELPDTEEDYRLVQPIGMFEFLAKDQPIALSDKGTLLTCPEEGYALMCPNTSGPLCAKEALLFLAEKHT